MSLFKKLLYIGAGCHIDPVQHFSKTQEFIFIDTLPRSEWDQKGFYEELYRRSFMDDLIYTCSQYGFRLEFCYELDRKYKYRLFSITQYLYYLCCKVPSYVNPTLLTFKNEKTGQLLKYYISTNIKYNMNSFLAKDIRDADGFIMCGYDPESLLLQYFNKPKAFIGYSDTSYAPDLNGRETVVNYLNIAERSLYVNYFDKFYFISNYSGNMVECSDFGELRDMSEVFSMDCEDQMKQDEP